MTIYLDNESTSFQVVAEEVRVASNSYGRLDVSDYLYSGSFKPLTKKPFTYATAIYFNGVDTYAQRIEDFLNEFSNKNQIGNRQKVTEIIYSNKALLSQIEELIAEVTILHGDKLDRMVIRSLSNDEDGLDYIFLTFHMSSTHSVREVIDLESSFKMERIMKQSDVLNFAFI